jgi:hypothetical protein
MIDTQDPLPTGLLLFQDSFRLALGTFHAAWSSLDVTTDFAICQFLKVTPQQAHMITGGMMFGPKARLLGSLIKDSNHAKKSEMLGAVRWLQGNSKRDVFAHGYMITSSTKVILLERPRGGGFKVKEHPFTLEQFIAHTKQVGSNAQTFWQALGASNADLAEFVAAALSLDNKSTTSPGEPADRA